MQVFQLCCNLCPNFVSVQYAPITACIDWETRYENMGLTILDFTKNWTTLFLGLLPYTNMGETSSDIAEVVVN